MYFDSIWLWPLIAKQTGQLVGHASHDIIGWSYTSSLPLIEFDW